MSILENSVANSAERNVRSHDACGGTIHSGSDHVYCERCGAVAYYGDGCNEETWEDAMESIQRLSDGESNL